MWTQNYEDISQIVIFCIFYRNKELYFDNDRLFISGWTVILRVQSSKGTRRRKVVTILKKKVLYFTSPSYLRCESGLNEKAISPQIYSVQRKIGGTCNFFHYLRWVSGCISVHSPEPWQTQTHLRDVVSCISSMIHHAVCCAASNCFSWRHWEGNEKNTIVQKQVRFISHAGSVLCGSDGQYYRRLRR